MTRVRSPSPAAMAMNTLISEIGAVPVNAPVWPLMTTRKRRSPRRYAPIQTGRRTGRPPSAEIYRV
jgi:hypothetical protein